MLDSELAKLYGAQTFNPNKAVKRNIGRFSADFMFRLTWEEARALRFQTGMLEPGRGRHRKYPPHAFTEQGVAMLSSVLRSERAVQVNIEIVRAFVRLRELLAGSRDLAREIRRVEKRCDSRYKTVCDAIRELVHPPQEPRRRIGFQPQGRRSGDP